MHFPTPPQCLTTSPRRWAGLPLMKTDLLPVCAFQVLPPQHAV